LKVLLVLRFELALRHHHVVGTQQHPARDSLRSAAEGSFQGFFEDSLSAVAEYFPDS